jgi:hypothetical protein
LLYPAELQAHVKPALKKRINIKRPRIVQDKFYPQANVESALALSCKMLYPLPHLKIEAFYHDRRETEQGGYQQWQALTK